MSRQYVRPYMTGAVTPKGWTVVCVPGMKASEVVEPLATRLANLVLSGKVIEARGLMLWFGGEFSGGSDGGEANTSVPV